MAASSGLFLVTIYDQSQLAERKHVARYWSINTAAMAVPLSVHPSPLDITRKLAVAILGIPLFGGGALPAQYYLSGWRATILAINQLPRPTQPGHRLWAGATSNGDGHNHCQGLGKGFLCLMG